MSEIKDVNRKEITLTETKKVKQKIVLKFATNRNVCTEFKLYSY